MTPPIVFFNASVILAGMASKTGGSATLLRMAKQKVIRGAISEIVADEALRHAGKIGRDPSEIRTMISILFPIIAPPPDPTSVIAHAKLVLDPGDAHVLASCQETKARYLVTLDKKHLLIIQDSITWVTIVSPGQLLERL